MTITGSIDAIGQAGTTEKSQTSGAGDARLGRFDFLRLLMVQMKNQSPTNPMKGHQLASHLAQFSSLEELIAIGNTLKNKSAMTEQLTQSLNHSMAADLIGKTIQAEGNTVELNGGGSVDLSFSLNERAETATVQVVGPAGNVVRTLDLGSLSDGDHTITWDGRDGNGNTLPDGVYRFSVTAKDGDGNPIATQTYLQGMVERVRFYKDGVELSVNGFTVPLQDVRSVLS